MTRAPLTAHAAWRRTGESPGTVYAWAINTNCATVAAFPLDTMLGDVGSETGPCGAILTLDKAVACQPVGDYRCRAHPTLTSTFDARCVDSLDPFQAVEISLII